MFHLDTKDQYFFHDMVIAYTRIITVYEHFWTPISITLDVSQGSYFVILLFLGFIIIYTDTLICRFIFGSLIVWCHEMA